MVAIPAVLCGLAWAGMWTAHRFILKQELLTHNDVAGPIMGTIGTILAVLLSFMVVTVWSQYNDSENTVQKEASAIADLHRLAGGFSDPFRTELHADLDRYLRDVIDAEWPKMRTGGISARAQRDAIATVSLVNSYTPRDAREVQLDSQVLELTRNMIDSRRLRLHDNETGIPPVLWVVMLLTSAIAVCFMYLFRVERPWMRFAMVVAFTATVALIFVLIAELDYPFRGDTHITPHSFILVDEQLHSR